MLAHLRGRLTRGTAASRPRTDVLDLTTASIVRLSDPKEELGA
jgi:hypothetical protein